MVFTSANCVGITRVADDGDVAELSGEAEVVAVNFVPIIGAWWVHAIAFEPGGERDVVIAIIDGPDFAVPDDSALVNADELVSAVIQSGKLLIETIVLRQTTGLVENDVWAWVFSRSV